MKDKLTEANPIVRFLFTFAILSFFLFSPCLPLLGQREKKKKTEMPNPESVRRSDAEAMFIEGEKFFVLEDYSKALLYFSRAAELHPTNGAVFYKLAEVLSKSEKEEDVNRAITQIDRAIKLDSKNKYFYQLASNLHSRLQQFSTSAELLETMIKEVPETEEYLYELATFYRLDRKDADAITAYDRAEAALGVNDISSIEKQRIYLEQGKLPEAIAEVEKLVRVFPEEERYVVLLAELQNQNKQPAKAMATVEEFIKANPDAANSRILLNALYRTNGEEKKSRALVTALIDDPLAPLSTKVMVLTPYTREITQRKERGMRDKDVEEFAVSLFAKLEQAYPNESDVHVFGGDLFLSLERDDQAKANYRKAVRNGTKSFDAWQNLLILETQHNEYDSTIVHAEQALELFPYHASMYYFSGYAHFRKRSYREATHWLEEAKKRLEPNDSTRVDINSLLGEAYEALKEYDKSAKSYEEALAINPMYDVVLNNYSYYLSLRKADLEKAEKMSTLLVKNQPTDAAYLDTHAWVLYQRGKYKEARKVMEKAIATGNGVAVHYEHYGDILFQLGDNDGAVAQWRKAKTMVGHSEMIDKKIANRRID